jgi:hypothetical protein
MKVRALTTFGGANKTGRIHVSAGDVFELPDGVDWLKAGLVELVDEPLERETATAEPVENAAMPKTRRRKAAGSKK